MQSDHSIHIPVLPEEILQGLQPTPGMCLLDGTLGGGGHTLMLAERVAPDGRVIAIDRDMNAVEKTEPWLRTQIDAMSLLDVFCVSYEHADRALTAAEVESLDGVLLDLGLSSDQLLDRNRGF
ncbi:MAG: 16S rRNA (cytosine(1402)-N(4))-methyltransferase, partial [Planctomycetota bacterium]